MSQHLPHTRQGFTLLELLIVMAIILLFVVGTFPMLVAMKTSIDLNNTGNLLLSELNKLQTTAFAGTQSGSGRTEVYMFTMRAGDSRILGYPVTYVRDGRTAGDRNFHIDPQETGPWTITDGAGTANAERTSMEPFVLPDPMKVLRIYSPDLQKEFSLVTLYTPPFERSIYVLGAGTTSPKELEITYGTPNKHKTIHLQLPNGREELRKTQ